MKCENQEEILDRHVLCMVSSRKVKVTERHTI
nr:MAG TPA: hypothetical protein [Caudoviricetes sp.]